MTPFTRSALTLAFLALPLAAQAGPRHRSEQIARVLNLTEAQQTSIKALRDKHRPEMLARREATRQAQGSLRTALQDPATAEPQLRTLHDRASAARFELMLARRSMHQDIEALLTPAQRLKAAELRGVARARMQNRRQHRWEVAGAEG